MLLLFLEPEETNALHLICTLVEMNYSHLHVK